MFKKLKKVVKSVGKVAEKSGVSKLAGKVGRIGSGKGTGAVAAGAGAGLIAKRSGMTMGELDKMRAETGQVAAIPREAMAEDETKEV